MLRADYRGLAALDLPVAIGADSIFAHAHFSEPERSGGEARLYGFVLMCQGFIAPAMLPSRAQISVGLNAGRNASRSRMTDYFWQSSLSPRE